MVTEKISSFSFQYNPFHLSYVSSDKITELYLLQQTILIICYRVILSVYYHKLDEQTRKWYLPKETYSL